MSFKLYKLQDLLTCWLWYKGYAVKLISTYKICRLFCRFFKIFHFFLLSFALLCLRSIILLYDIVVSIIMCTFWPHFYFMSTCVTHIKAWFKQLKKGKKNVLLNLWACLGLFAHCGQCWTGLLDIIRLNTQNQYDGLSALICQIFYLLD